MTARTQGALEKLRHEYPGQVECLTGDMADMSTGPKAVELAKSKFKTLDGLVINHGILEPMERIATGDVQEWRKAFDINYFSAVSLVMESSSVDQFYKRILICDRSKQLCQRCAPPKGELSLYLPAQRPTHTRHGAHTAARRPR